MQVCNMCWRPLPVTSTAHCWGGPALCLQRTEASHPVAAPRGTPATPTLLDAVQPTWQRRLEAQGPQARPDLAKDAHQVERERIGACG